MGTRQEYTFIGVNITTDPTQAFTWAALQTSPSPDEGSTIPTTFVNVPIVEILRVYGDAKFYIADGDVTVTGVTISSSGFNDAPPIKVDLRVVSRETIAPTAGTQGTAVVWPFYCTLNDVKDKLTSMEMSFGTSGNLTDTVLNNAISAALGDINGAAGMGGYALPVVNGSVTTINAGATASANAVTLGIVDITKITAGDLVFIHGASGSTFNAEFVGVVNVDTTAKTAVVLFLRQAYNSGSTIETCSQAFKVFRECNAISAAMKALNSTTVGQSIGKNEKVSTFEGFLAKCLKGLMEGTIALDGLSKRTGAIKTFQTENPDATDVKNGPVWHLDMHG